VDGGTAKRLAAFEKKSLKESVWGELKKIKIGESDIIKN
jgi:hypothetical protein